MIFRIDNGKWEVHIVEFSLIAMLEAIGRKSILSWQTWNFLKNLKNKDIV